MMVIPELFLCPISLDLMSDPVTLLASARTYDRPNIHRWFAAGQRTCPVTMHPLPKSVPERVLLVPNRTLKHLIDRWLLTGRTLSISDLALPTLKDNLLVLHTGTDNTTVVEETLRIVRSLSPPGFCALLLCLLLKLPSRRHDDDSAPAHLRLVELALDCLVASPSAQEIADALQTGDASSFALLLRQGSLKVKTGLCRLIHIAADAMAEQQQLYKTAPLGRAEPVMAALAALMHDSGAVSDAALRAMSSLCLSDQASRETVVAAGAVDALLSYISSSTTGAGTGPCRKKPSGALCTLALETLERVLVNVDAGRQDMYGRPGATAVLVKMIFRVPFDHAGGSSEPAIGALLAVCRESAVVRVDAINAGLLTQLLMLLQSQCGSPRAKTKARALLKLFRAIWARHYSYLSPFPSLVAPVSDREGTLAAAGLSPFPPLLLPRRRPRTRPGEALPASAAAGRLASSRRGVSTGGASGPGCHGDGGCGGAAELLPELGGGAGSVVAGRGRGGWRQVGLRPALLRRQRPARAEDGEGPLGVVVLLERWVEVGWWCGAATRWRRPSGCARRRS